MSYLRDPAAIYAESFRVVREEAELGRFGTAEAEFATRLIHACGMTDIAESLVISNDCVAAGRAALTAGAPILCDVEMVACGIIRRSLPKDGRVIVTLKDQRVPEIARKLATTRSAAAVEFWRDFIDGAVVAIGNAPTALLHLLDRLALGWPAPAVILGFPVGFVGAAESKEELVRAAPCPFAALPGRRGGSAMAAAAVNALSLGLNGDGT